MSLDNPEQGLSRSGLVDALRAKEEASAPVESTDEVVEASQEVEEAVEEEVVETSEDHSEEEAAPVEQELYSFKADGKDREVTAEEYERYAQQGFNYYAKSETLANEKKAFEAEQAELREKINAERAQVNDKLMELSNLIGEQDKAVDWDELMESDPSEYLRQQKKQQARQRALQEAQQEQQAKAMQHQQQLVNNEAARLRQLWSTEDAMKQGVDNTNSALRNVGFTDDQIGQMVDHRVYVLADKAAKYDQMMSKDTKKKQVKTPPKQVKSGLKKSASSNRAEEDAMTRLKKSGKKNDAFTLLKIREQKR